jgi:hypothetical protein
MDEPWKIEILSPAVRDLRTISRELGDDGYDEIIQDIIDLEETLSPLGHLRLRGTKSDYRTSVRCGRSSSPRVRTRCACTTSRAGIKSMADADDHARARTR